MANMAFNLAGPVGYRRFHLEKKCELSEGHEHNYDHSTCVHRGRIQLTKGDKVTEHGPGEWVFIEAGVRHTIKALEDNTVYDCVFSHRDFDGLVSQRYVGNVRAYD